MQLPDGRSRKHEKGPDAIGGIGTFNIDTLRQGA